MSEKTIQELIKDDDELKKLSEKTSLTSSEGKKILKKSLEKEAINEKFEDSSYKLDSSIDTDESIIDSIKNDILQFVYYVQTEWNKIKPYLYHINDYKSVGNVEDIEYKEKISKLTLYVQIDDEERTIPLHYTLDTDNGPDKELSAIIKMLNTDRYRPSTLLNKKVPLKNTNYGSYDIHIYPYEYTFLSKAKYKILRKLDSYHLFQNKDDKFTPTQNVQLILLFVTLFSTVITYMHVENTTYFKLSILAAYASFLLYVGSIVYK